MTRPPGHAAAVPRALKLAYACGVPLIALVYKRRYGAGNFLWLSDLCLGLTTMAVLTESPRPASIAAGVLPLELAWNADFLCRGRLLGLADYMFDRRLPLWLRALSLFHVAVPATLVWLLRRFGYDRRALPAQIAMTGGAVVLSRALTEREKNINWAFGPGARGRSPLPAPLYLALETMVLTCGMLLPAHLMARRFFARADAMSIAPRDFALIGHRGARGLFPENTLEGFAATLALGVKMIELDVAVTADDVVVVSHDPRLNPDLTRDRENRWLAAPGPPIRQLRYEALRGYDVGRIKPGSAYARRFADQSPRDGARIPMLAEVLALDPRVLWAIELKTFPQHPDLTVAPERMADLVLAVVEAENAPGRIILQSFDWRGLDHVRRRDPRIALAWLTEKQAGHRSSALPRVAAAAQGAADASRWMPQFAELDASLVEEAHARGLAVIPWDVNDAAAIGRALQWRVDGIITDRPDIALRLLRAR